jgi:hypothetical protein
MIKFACKILKKALLSNDIFTFCANIKYHRTILGLAIIKIFLKISIFFQNYLFEISEFKKITKGKKYKNCWKLRNFLL